MTADSTRSSTTGPSGSGRAALLVSAGIFLSRIAGLVRARAVAHWLGTGFAADAVSFAIRIPNLLQNLLGEGVLSASFIPVYAEMSEDDEEAAGRLAGAVAGLLAAAAGGAALLIAVLAAPLTSLIAPGLDGVPRETTIVLLRIVAPGTALLVLSAWCLGILNTHRQFFLSYVSPVVWNAAQIAFLMAGGLLAWRQIALAEALAWGVVVGGLLQFLVQLPAVRRAEPNLRLSFDRSAPGVSETLSRFGPAVLGRGVVQISAFVDLALASLIANGARASLDQAQVLYLLPISLFAMSVAAAELPDLARERRGSAEQARRRIVDGLGRIQFFVAFSALAYLLAGAAIAGAVFQSGRFGQDSTALVGTILAAYALGIPAISASRLLQNVAFSQGDTRSPAIIAAIRVVIAAGLGAALMFPLDGRAVLLDGSTTADETVIVEAEGDYLATERGQADGRDGLLRMGAVGLAIGSAAASWVEFALLATLVRRRVPGLRLGPPMLRPVPSLVPTIGVLLALGAVTTGLHPLLRALLILGPAGLTYVGVANAIGAPEARRLTRAVRARLR